MTIPLDSIEEIELFPYFQPIICASSGTIVGYEALARQYHNGRVVSAGELFSSRDIPVQQLILWDRGVRRRALEKFLRISPNAYLTLNISTVWLDHVLDLNVLPTLQMLDELNIDRNRVIIEITEAKGDLNKLIKVVDVYRQHGLKVAIDDFGAGFSQLERVMAIHPDIIKLDISLFKQASKGGIANDVVHLLTRLAERSGCRIVCEGVETEDEFFFSLSCGAQYMQGYLFSAAEAEFKNPAHYQHLIESLRSKYLQKSLSKHQEKFIYTGKIKDLLNKLRQSLSTGFNPTAVPTQPFENSGILRFYLCNNKGDQISPSYSASKGKWLADDKHTGFNWSWRPYFYELLALEFVKDGRPLITSERYRDFNTGVLCKTLSIRLDQERILLVDIAAEWP